jgi:CheY-like chemotaxis protein
MPIMDGYNSTYQIRKFLTENRIKQPIITAVTGHTEESYVKKCFEYGMN